MGDVSFYQDGCPSTYGRSVVSVSDVVSYVEVFCRFKVSFL